MNNGINGIVYVVDDDPAVRSSIELMVQVMGVRTKAFESAEEFLASLADHQHGCLITDVRMVGMSGVQLLQEITNRHIPLPAIILTAYADVRIAVQSIRAGAVTLLEKPYREQELWDAVVEALTISRSTASETELRKRVHHSLSQLTPDESHVMHQMLKGTPNKLIASMLDIAPRTVDIRRQAVLRKMGVSNAIHLVRLLGKAGVPDKTSMAELSVIGRGEESAAWDDLEYNTSSWSRAVR